MKDNKKPLNFAITGVGGYIAPRHLQAIKDTGNNLVAALDKNDSVGVLDKYFDDVKFFTEFERFDRHAEKLRQADAGKEIDYVSICSPNYLHDSHIRFALRIGAHAICEKPIVLNPWNIDQLATLEQQFPGKINTILQLRYHPTILALKEKYQDSKNVHDISLTYITPRGHWYDVSWKGDIEKSGGVTTNIGVHFFDMLMWIFGDAHTNDTFLFDAKKASGFLGLDNANVKWYLSLDKGDLADKARTENKAYRSITIDGEEIEFSDGFRDLHTAVYENILNGNGFGLQDARPSITVVSDIRNKELVNPLENRLHPFAKREFEK